MENIKQIWRLKNPSLIHFVALVGLTGFMLAPLTWTVKLPPEHWIKQLLQYILLGCLYAANVFIFVPRLLNKAKGLVYLFTMILVVWVMVQINNQILVISHFNEVLAKIWAANKINFTPDPHFEAKWMIMMSIIVIGVSNVSAFAGRTQKDQLALQIFEKDKIHAELSFLKAQINPHFLFNTLHSTYALIDVDTEAAKDALYTLSHMMRYVIYDTSHDHATLAKEIGFINDYIKLMKTRMPENVKVTFERPEHTNGATIAPMLLLPFIENAFKHGISAIGDSFISVSITNSAQGINMKVRNKVPDQTSADIDGHHGIGIANTRRRLDLLYPGRYTLDITVDEALKEYSVVLQIRR